MLGLKPVRRSLLVGLLCLASLGTSATPASAYFTTSRVGAVGHVLAPYYGQKLIVCTAGNNNYRAVTAGGTRVTRTARYPRRAQVISGIAHLEVFNGADFVHYAWGQWRSKKVLPGRVAKLTGYTWTVPSNIPNGWTWRVSMRYEWRVRGVLVGRRIYYFEYLDYHENDFRDGAVIVLQGEIVTGNTPDGQSSWCWMP